MNVFLKHIYRVALFISPRLNTAVWLLGTSTYSHCLCNQFLFAFFFPSPCKFHLLLIRKPSKLPKKQGVPQLLRHSHQVLHRSHLLWDHISRKMILGFQKYKGLTSNELYELGKNVALEKALLRTRTKLINAFKCLTL